MDSSYKKMVYVLLCIKQKLDLESICRELEIDLDQLELLLTNLIKWGLVEFNDNTIIYSLTPAAENILKYSEREFKDSAPLIRIS